MNAVATFCALVFGYHASRRVDIRHLIRMLQRVRVEDGVKFR